MSKKCGEYCVGDEIAGGKIARIIGQDKNIIVGTNERGTVIYSIENEENISGYSRKALKLRMLLESIPSDSEFKSAVRVKQDIGYAFFSSCTCDGKVKYNDHFKNTEEKVKNLIEHTREQRYNNLTFYNVLQSIIVCLALYVFSLFVQEDHIKIALFFMGGGVIGSCLSLLQRNNKLDLSAFSSKSHLALSAFLSVMLGVLVGFVIYWVTKTQIYVTAINGDQALAFLLSVGAGSSERFFNSLMKKVKA